MSRVYTRHFHVKECHPGCKLRLAGVFLYSYSGKVLDKKNPEVDPEVDPKVVSGPLARKSGARWVQGVLAD